MKKDKKKSSDIVDDMSNSFKLKKTERMRISGSRGMVGKIILGIILLLIAVFFIRIALWEHSYYNEKEGSPRPEVQAIVAHEELDESEVTEEQRYEYTVPAENPRYLTIEKLGIRNARILSMGINAAGELDTPRNIFDVGWYSQSAKPGLGGTLVIDGHNGGPNIEGVFKHINTLYNGDLITVERGDGAKFTYKVVENKEIPLSEADAYMGVAFSSPVTGTESLTLISCIGEWSMIQDTYLSRQFTRAILVQN